MKLKKLVSSILAVCLMAFVFAGCTSSSAGGDSSSMIPSLVMLVLLFVMMYFFMIRPEKKRKQEAQTMRDSLEVGDKIITIGGIVGRVVHISNDRITFETGEDRVRLEVTKWAISSNESKGKEKADSEEQKPQS